MGCRMKLTVRSVENEGADTFIVHVEVSETAFGTIRLSSRLDATTFSDAAEKARQGLSQFAADLLKASDRPGSFG